MQILLFDLILIEKMMQVKLENEIFFLKNQMNYFLGKLIYQSSLIDEEIKKPLVLETLKLALPKKKLHTL
jgi:hypothetical protein